MHEYKLTGKGLFVTLTYDDENLKDLNKRDLQLFFKRLRREFPGKRIKYFACGEYGERTLRPHYHMILYGLTLKDLECYLENGIYQSEYLKQIWPLGFNTIGHVSVRSIRYVVNYILKSYNVIKETGKKPIQLQSQGLGLGFVKDDIRLEEGYLIVDGKKRSIPRYYVKKLKYELPEYRSEREILNKTIKHAMIPKKPDDVVNFAPQRERNIKAKTELYAGVL